VTAGSAGQVANALLGIKGERYLPVILNRIYLDIGAIFSFLSSHSLYWLIALIVDFWPVQTKMDMLLFTRRSVGSGKVTPLA
jgi:hypothetical protein